MKRITGLLTRFLFSLAAFLSFFASAGNAVAAPHSGKTSSVIKVGSFNICDPNSRMKQIKSGAFTSNQKCWSKSAGAVAAMINKLDCDVIGFQEVGDSTWGRRGDKGICSLVDARRPKKSRYVWVAYPNTKKGTFSYNTALAFRKDVFKLLDDGIFWLGGDHNVPKVIPGGPKGTHRPVHYAKLVHKKSKQKFWFFSSHLFLERSNNRNGGNLFNAKNLLSFIETYVPKEDRVVIVGDFNAHFKSPSYKEITGAGFKNAYAHLKKQDKLSENVLKAGTQPKKDESGFGTWVPDHVFVRGFDVLSFEIDRSMLPTEDGTLHFPSDHLPVTAELLFK